MRHTTIRLLNTFRWAAAVVCLSLPLGVTSPAWSTTAPDMDKYTSHPVFLNNTVPPNILFVLDLNEKMLQAAYGYYPESSGANISSNVTGTGLCNVNQSGSPAAGCPAASGSTDNFDPAKEYYGMFDGTRCYTYSSNEFHPDTSVTKSTTAACSSDTLWDGNFLNWLTMRKTDLAKKALVGGKGSSAQCNTTGDCNKLLVEDGTGSDGGAGTCNNPANTCFRFVKAVTLATSQYYYPSTVPGVTAGSNRTTYFGVGEGDLFASDTATEDGIFGSGGSATRASYDLTMDLTPESSAKRQELSTGLFQGLRQSDMRVSVMFTNSDTTTSDAAGGKVQMYFDEKLVSSVYTNIRNTSLKRNAPLAETIYEALCYFKQNSTPCFSHSPANWVVSSLTKGDPYYFCNKDASGNCVVPVSGQMVRCCKSYIILISNGQPTADADSTLASSPFGNLMSTGTSNVGVTTSQLDDVALYGKTHDLRSDLVGNQNVTLYTVNAMGGTAGGPLLASASKYGGFEDNNSNLLPDSPVVTHTCTYPPVSSIGPGGSSSTSNSEWDRDPLDCEPDTYFDAAEGQSLKQEIEQAILAILKKSASGTSASVLASSSTGEGSMYQAYFYPKEPHSFSTTTDVVYTGYVTSFFIDSFGNFREDTNGDGRLVYGEDDIVQLRYDSASEEVKVERYKDVSPADGKADSPTSPYYSANLKDTTVAPLWEAGDKLADLSPDSTCTTAQAGVTCRQVLTWLDTNDDGAISSGETMQEFKVSNTRLAPYLNAGKSSLTTTQVINFIRGCASTTCPEQASLRDRRITNLLSVTKLWKLGDPINSTPTVVGAPRERYDLIYGDLSYTTFYQRYKDRRQVVYVGANDGMLHAFNAGFYHKGDDTSDATKVEHGWFTTDSSAAPTAATPRSNPARGAELWGYIPYELLPQLQWLARTDYGHSYYVDLKPKVTDVRIFTDDGATGHHPGGWGTILIGGFKLGGSCGYCTDTDGAPPMTFTATFESSRGSEDRTFYSGYFVLDITDPERDPILIGVFTNEKGLGLANSYPTVVRVNTTAISDKTDRTNAKWFAVFGSGMNGYKGTTNLDQQSQFFSLELKEDKTGAMAGPFITGENNAFMGDLISFDGNLDYRADAIYGGSTICHDNLVSPSLTCSGAGGPLTPRWIGKMNRFTTGDGKVTDPNLWTAPSTVVQEFSCTPSPSCTGATKVGPITGAPSITSDDSNNVWIFFGTGRYWDPVADKANVDAQYFIGVKDKVPRGICDLSTTDCQLKNLEDVSNVVVCSVCATITQVTGGPTGVSTFNALVKAITAKEGWYLRLPTSGERNLSAPTLLGGTLLFTTFVPSNDLCVVQGTGSLYALFYLTGSAYPDPLLGATASSTNMLNNKSVSLGTGLPSSVAVQLTRQGSGGLGGTTSSPCSGGLNAVIQGSTGEVHKVCGKPALSAWSRYLTWMNNRDS